MEYLNLLDFSCTNICCKSDRLWDDNELREIYMKIIV